MTPQQLEHQQHPQKISVEPLDKAAVDKVIQLLDEWMADDSGYDEETWPQLKEALDRERDLVSARRLFDE